MDVLGELLSSDLFVVVQTDDVVDPIPVGHLAVQGQTIWFQPLVNAIGNS